MTVTRYGVCSECGRRDMFEQPLAWADRKHTLCKDCERARRGKNAFYAHQAEEREAADLREAGYPVEHL